MSDLTTRPAVTEPVAPEETSLKLSTAPEPVTRRVGGPRRSARAFLLTAWRQLTSMRTALLLLTLLAMAAIPGSLIPQTDVEPQSVAHYIATHRTLGPLAQHLGLFNVFSSSWFAAIYLLLFVSLIGCLTQRIPQHVRALRRRPPPAPRRLLVLPTSAQWVSEHSPDDVVAATARLLRQKRWRVAVTEEPGVNGLPGGASVAAEKGRLRETGNLVFHVSLLLLLVGVALSGLLGYKGQVLVVQGSGFADATGSYASFSPPRVGDSALPPFSLTLQRFIATYDQQGDPASFDADVSYVARPGTPARDYDIRVNHPLTIGGASVYLINDGYAVDLTVRDPNGRVVASGATPFLSDTGTTNISASHGVVKVPDASPSQLGLQAELFADFDPMTETSVSSEARNPALAIAAFTGNLGLDKGVPQNDFTLDTTHLKRVGQTHLLTVGQKWRLPDGDVIRFGGVTPYAVFQVTHDPGKLIMLVAAGLILAGLTLSLRVRRRRFWVRAMPAGEGSGPRRTVVHAAGLTRDDSEDNTREFAALVSACGGPSQRFEE